MDGGCSERQQADDVQLQFLNGQASTMYIRL